MLGDSFFLTGLNGGVSLILKDALDNRILDAITKEAATRIVIQRFHPWGDLRIGSIASQIKELWIEDEDAPNDLALNFPWLASLHLKQQPNSGFLRNFPELVECQFDNLRMLPVETAELRKLRKLCFVEGCRFSDAPKIGQLGGLEKLVLSGRSLPKGPFCLEGLASLEYLGMSDWGGDDIEFVRPLKKLKECRLHYFPKVTSLNPLSCCLKLESISLANWPSLQRLIGLDGLSRLKYLLLENCEHIETLSPLFSISSLREVHLWEKTRIKDGNLKPLLNLPKLHTCIFKDRRNYNIKASALEQLLAGRNRR